MGLIDLSGDLGRVDGGVGLALRNPFIEMGGEPADATDATGPLSDRARDAAAATVRELGGDPVHITVTSTYPQHVGLGSGTQAALAAATLAARLNGHDPSIRELARITGRGGTSGIGVAAFESGGLVADGGHSIDAKGGFLPSSASEADPAPVVSRLDFPDWEIAVLLPEGRGAHGETERSVFERECPLPAEEADRVSRIVLMMLLPAAAIADFPLFRDAVEKLQKTGFKRRELDRKPRSRALAEELRSRGCAAGMSSFGPAVYAVHPDGVDADGVDAEVIRTRASNTGAEVTP